MPPLRFLLLSVLFCINFAPATRAERPNILWITSEDNGPHLGCYGDGYATTPHLDALAARGMIYNRCWSNAPVCAPARTAIITGVYPTSLGAEHMRSEVRLPPFMKLYPQFLREAGYYCTNNSKEDYNVVKPGKVWDESSPRAHWKSRKSGQPFFAVFNIGVTHESQIRRRPHKFVHDPAKTRVPAYHPDVPEVRQAWAQYYDQLTEMDALAGRHLKELEDAGLSDDTIVFYYGDHGPGLPRCKRSACDSGLRVPLIVHIPDKFKHLAPKDYAPGAKSDRLVQFVDLAPTVLSLAGMKPPEWMQGRAFMGPHEAEPNQFLHGFRGRMDERIDLVRSVTDGRYVYVANFMPHLPSGQHNDYMFQTPMTVAWKKLFDDGKLTPRQARYWRAPRQPEELYDLTTDPDEVNDLSRSPGHEEILERLRGVQARHAIEVRDVGLLPEGEMHARSGDSSPYEMGHDAARFDMDHAFAATKLAPAFNANAVPELPELVRRLRDDDSAWRYWAAMGLLMRGRGAVLAAGDAVERAMTDECPDVRVVAAHAQARYGSDRERANALGVLLDHANLRRHSIYVVVSALNAIDALDSLAAPIREKVAALPDTDPKVIGKMKDYVPRLKDAIRANHAAVPREDEFPTF